MNNFYLYIILILSLVATSSYSQVNYLDTSFGDDGTMTITRDTFEYTYILGIDSLENIYTGSYLFNFPLSGVSFALSKIDKEGDFIYRNRFPNEPDSSSFYEYNGNHFVTIATNGLDSYVTTYDLDFNILGRFNIPDRVNNSNIMITKDNGLQGLTTNTLTLFRFNQDGTLNYDFGNNGIIELKTDFESIESSLASTGRNWFNDSQQNIQLALATLDTQSAKSITNIKMSDLGELDYDYGNDGITETFLEFPNASTLQIYNVTETKDKGILHWCSYIDTIIYQYRYFSHKLDIDGNSKSSFGENGIFSFHSTPADSSDLFDRYYLFSELSNGSLAFINYDYNEEELFLGNYLVMTNENGTLESNFGQGGRLDLDYILPGHNLASYAAHNGNIYILEGDSTSFVYYLSKLDGDKLLDFTPFQLPNASSFLLYPNPVSDETIIEYKGLALDNLDLRVYDLNGQLLSTKLISNLYNYNEIPLSTSSLAAGIYYITIHQGDDKLWSSQFLKVKE